jgi:hypothetical protein
MIRTAHPVYPLGQPIFQETLMNPATRLMVTVSLALASGYVSASDQFTKQFPLASCSFIPFGGNAYFSVMPGRQLYYSNSACVASGICDELNELWITTEHDIKRIALPTGNNTSRPVFARVVEERETLGGELIEVSRNYFANCFPSRDVYYFGEDVDIYKGGQVVSHDGSWLVGRHGALPGIAMPEAGFIVGSRYFQEVAPGVALDRAEHKRVGFSMQVPAGKFDDCLEVEETTTLEPDDIGRKIYCRGVGLVKDDDLELTAIYGTH